jgi:hypothetical protein
MSRPALDGDGDGDGARSGRTEQQVAMPRRSAAAAGKGTDATRTLSFVTFKRRHLRKQVSSHGSLAILDNSLYSKKFKKAED